MMIKNISKYFVFLLLLFFNSSYAWDSTGHRLIAQIAYDNLNPVAKNHVDQLTQIDDGNYPPYSRFLYASIWPDQIKNEDVTSFNAWHFINLPFSTDGTATVPPDNQNVVWAIGQSVHVLTSQQAKPEEKAMFLRFLIHFVGDAHQPLHCAERFSRAYPRGDNSGNLFIIQDPYVTNLHAFWDEGLGWFRRYGKDYPLTNREVGWLANRIERDYPASYFGSQANNLNAADWAQQSFVLAKNNAYDLNENSKPSSAYIARGQTIAEQQIALAGYRLANYLNWIFAVNH